MLKKNTKKEIMNKFHCRVMSKPMYTKRRENVYSYLQSKTSVHAFGNEPHFFPIFVGLFSIGHIHRVNSQFYRFIF